MIDFMDAVDTVTDRSWFRMLGSFLHYSPHEVRLKGEIGLGHTTNSQGSLHLQQDAVSGERSF
jgi:hypothetical protein